jgi:hypothetical protein
MIMGTVLHGKRYSPAEYVCMTLIGVGVALFGKKGSDKVSSKLVNPNTGMRLLLLPVALCDKPALPA